jgi:hypothetical protein
MMANSGSKNIPQNRRSGQRPPTRGAPTSCGSAEKTLVAVTTPLSTFPTLMQLLNGPMKQQFGEPCSA